jgi:RNA polymerase sigma factor (sigma-70 family)
MVMQVCRKVLRDEHDALDAFQAVFLILVRRAGSLRIGDSLGPWLHAVALRVATSARDSANRRRALEQKAIAMANRPVVRVERADDDLGPAIHEEIGRLPDGCRKAVVLCDLEGLSHEEAARRLGWPVGTVKSRQARGRDKLRSRLTRRGLAPVATGAAALLATQRASAALPMRIVDSTARVAALVAQNQAAAGLISTATIVLSQGVLRAMLLNRIKIAASALILAGSFSAATAWSLQAARPADPPEQTSKADVGLKEFDLKVVGPNGKPVPNAEVEIRSEPSIMDEQIRRGSFVKNHAYGTVTKVDGDGRLVLKLPKVPTSFQVFITISGYGPYWTGWSSDEHQEPIPARFTAELDAAWSVGGIVVDPEGKPIQGVNIQPSIEFKKRPGVTKQFGSGARVKTDAKGKWQFDSVPVSMDEVHVAIDHPGFMPLRCMLKHGEFGIDRGREPAAKIVLDRGLAVTGKVTDEAGKPIAGALVRTHFYNEAREARTGGDGAYTLVGCEARPARIVASAKGRAIDLKELNIEPGMGPVDFALKPGGTVRIRVLDHEGKPVPKARIFFQRWRGDHAYFEFEPVNQYADQDGIWAWNEAPLDEFTADICPPGGMQMSSQSLIARAEEYVFRTPAPLVVSGKVFDAKTREPIQEFRVVPGVRWNKERLHWNDREGFKVSDGKYQIRQTRGEFAHLIRIEADGYRSAVSRDIKSDEGAITLDFALEQGHTVIAKVVTPQNVSAKGAKVALGVAGSQIIIKNGDFDKISTFCAQETTDDSGRFQFPAQDKDFQLIIVHPSGYAHIKSPAEWKGARIIHLEPWARAEGTFRVGPKPAVNVPLRIDTVGHDSYGPEVAHISTGHEATTGPDGHFVFERVFPGRGSIGREITFMVDSGATEVTSSCKIRADFPGGKTTHLDLGGTGRAVIGKLLPREGFAGKARWNFATVWVRPDLDDAGEVGVYITASIDRDGTFRIDDVPAGKYMLDVRFDRDDAGHLRNHPLEVPAAKGEAPIDLGILKLEK